MDYTGGWLILRAVAKKRDSIAMIKQFFFFSMMLVSCATLAQDKRSQYPKILSNAYFGLDIGYIDYPFSNQHLNAGYSAEAVHIPQPAVRLTLFGYRFNEHLSARITYMRPTNWVEYRNINGDLSKHTVWMNFGGLTLKWQTPLAKKLSVYGEAGLGLITRSGFKINDQWVINDAGYASVQTGAGLQYNVNKKWGLVAAATYTPEHKKSNQPYSMFYTGGFVYNMQPLPEEKVKQNTGAYHFPRQLLQVAYTSNVLGYGVNKAVSEGPVPIFWGGDVVVKNGVAVNYQRNLFHTRKVFSLDWGASVGYWKTRSNDDFYSVSVYPLLRFTALRTKPADVYLFYQVAGPTLLSKRYIDDYDTGRKFTFRDFMGAGAFIGKNRKLNAEINIGHFSNGNVYPENPGVKIPLSFTAGMTF